MTILSIVVPVYNGELFLDQLCKRISKAISEIPCEYEIILVDDFSPDSSWKIIQYLASTDKRIKALSLSRNFGQHSAISAGLAFTKGDWVIIMDCDLQDRPEEIVHLYQKAEEGYDAVLAKRCFRKDPWLKIMCSMLFYRLFNYLLDTKLDSSIGNFGIYNRKIITAILSMKDKVRYFPAMVQWVGFNQTSISVRHDARSTGKSSYTFIKLLKLAINNIISFTDKPLRISIFLGALMCMITLILGLNLLWRYFQNNILVSGYTSIILSLWFLCGMIIFLLGVQGLYIGQCFNQVKGRPIFFIKEFLNLDDNQTTNMGQ